MTPDPLASFPAVSTRSIAFQGKPLSEGVNAIVQETLTYTLGARIVLPGA
jgi:hypothetical protein